MLRNRSPRYVRDESIGNVAVAALSLSAATVLAIILILALGR